MRKHLNLKRIKNLTTYQKLSIGSWKNAKDPSIYSFQDLNYEKMKEFVEDMRKRRNLRITPTYTVAQAVSLVFAAHPRLNTLLRMGVLYQREKVNFSFLVALDAPASLPSAPAQPLNLSSCVVRDMGRLTLGGLYEVLGKKIQQTKSQQDEVVRVQDRLLRKIPTPLMGWFLDVSSFLLYTLNIRWKGMPEDPFGSVMISNLGQMGIDNAYIPLVPYTKVPVVLAIGLLKPRPVVRGDGQVVAQDTLRVHYTIDHRYIEGKSLALMNRMVMFVFENPARWLPPAPRAIKEEFKTEFYQSPLSGPFQKGGG